MTATGHPTATAPPTRPSPPRRWPWAVAVAVAAGLVAAVLSAGFGRDPTVVESVLLDRAAPPLAGPTLSGGSFDLADHRGEVVLAAEPAAPLPRRMPRRLRWAGLAGAFVAATAGLLATNLAPRGQGDPPTGNLPQQSSAQGAVDEEIARYREAVTRDPRDTRSRLLLAALLLRAGRIADAEAQVDRLLQHDPGNLDALVLAGVAKLQQGDPAGRRALRRVLDAAPADHPGRPIAEGLLNPDAAP